VSDDRRIRVAVLGGGCAAVAAALELTAPEQHGRYDVTVYQLGWRLGGKGASGRGPAGRIEEHGLHVWMGWYENAFRLLRGCYEELGRDWRAAFDPAPHVAVTDQLAAGGWAPWIRAFPAADGLPGDARASSPWTIAEYMTRTARLVRVLLDDLGGVGVSGPLRAVADPGEALSVLSRVGRLGELATLAGITQVVGLLEIVLGSLREYSSNLVLRILDAVATNARALLEARLGDDLEASRIWNVIDLALATLRGSVRFGLVSDPRGFDAIDGYDCREWLLLNGASRRAVDCGYLRALYDLSFAYEDADPARPRVSAAEALRGFFRAFFTYRGAFFWKMNGGMGDVVFAPIYEVLRRRGVRFEFFHRLRDVRIADADALARGETPHVTALELDVQATVRGGAPYAPLVDVGGMPCWPSEPDWTQLEDGERLRHEERRFECHWDMRRAATRTLHVGSDFDLVVLGVGLGAIPYVCGSLLAADPRWREMMTHVKTVATQAFQLWLRPELSVLGWTGPPVILSGFVQPFDTWADMHHLLGYERWPDPAPGTLAYFCSALPDLAGVNAADRAYPERQREAVRGNATRFLEREIHHLWPGAVDAAGCFRWDLLVSANGEASEATDARFRTQYWTANVNPSDRYTLALPGSSAYRISPLDPTYDNLTVCGDWTACGFNSGCVESAVMSGRLAAHALSRRPALTEIVGFDHP
jgi:uncharacterized protein with NAD-binding domain and iron-sulfur cluster